MGLLSRFLPDRDKGPRLRPEALRSILLMADEDAGEPAGDPMDLVMRAYHARNPELFTALFKRDLLEQLQLGFGRFPRAQRTDPDQLAQLVKRSHGEDVTAFAQHVAHPLREGAAPTELTLLTVYRLEKGRSAPAGIAPTEGPLLPQLDLTSPTEGRAR